MHRYTLGGCHSVMKRFILLVSLVVIMIGLGCEKSESNKPPFSDSLVGSWELRHASAAMNPQVSTPPPRNGNILKFTSTGYERYEAHQLVKTGQYEVIQDPTVESSVCLLFPVGQFTNRIEYDNNSIAEKQFIHLFGTKLVIVAGCYALDGGYRREYEKISEGD